MEGVMASDAGEALRRSAESAWDRRWTFVQDANGDGSVTGADVAEWAGWVFFAPGDWILLGLMRTQPDTAMFLDITPELESGLLSGIISLAVWIGILAFFGALRR
jgi:hypothetical protein